MFVIKLPSVQGRVPAPLKVLSETEALVERRRNASAEFKKPISAAAGVNPE